MSSFHGTTIKTTVSNLIRVIGEPDEEVNDGRDKTNFDWYNLTLGGHKVTIYDWKEYRRISEDEIIEFHIGGDSELETIDAKQLWDTQKTYYKKIGRENILKIHYIC